MCWKSPAVWALDTPEGNDLSSGSPSRPSLPQVGPVARTARKRVLGLWCPSNPALAGAPLVTTRFIMRFHEDSSPTLPATTLLRAVTAPHATPAEPDQAAMDAHLARSRYGRFTLTEAVRPGWHLDVVPQAGFRHDAYIDPRTGGRMPAVIAAVSSEDLFSTFLELIEPFGDACDVVLESSHDSKELRRELTREGVERLVLESMLWEYEDLLLNDGCTSIAVMHPELSLEVQLDEHKLLIVYAHARSPFERVFSNLGLGRDDRMRFISQGEHLHTSHERFANRFEELVNRLGAG